jgi:hypothetical protein
MSKLGLGLGALGIVIAGAGGAYLGRETAPNNTIEQITENDVENFYQRRFDRCFEANNIIVIDPEDREDAVQQFADGLTEIDSERERCIDAASANIIRIVTSPEQTEGEEIVINLNPTEG